MTRHQSNSPSRPVRAIAMSADVPAALRLLGVLAAALALAMLGSVREAVGSANRLGAGPDVSTWHAYGLTRETPNRDVLPAASHADVAALRAANDAGTGQAGGTFSDTHAIPHRATLRAADRARRAAGRAGISARRDTGGPSAVVVTADAALAHPAGAAPNDAEIACSPTHRGLHACGVRGPPDGSARLG